MRKILLVLVLVLISCSQPTAPQLDELSVERYFPLAIGNIWIYVDNYSDTLTIEVVDNHIDQGITVWEVNVGTVGFEYLCKDGELREIDKRDGGVDILLKEPLEDNASWDSEGYTVTITQTGFSYLGFPNCIRTDWSFGDHQIFSLDIGIIEWDKRKLISYELK
jgi:hypothetical protein